MNFSTFISTIQSQSFDSGKNNLLGSLITSLSSAPSAEDVVKLMRLYGFDSGRNKALKIICSKFKLVFEDTSLKSLLNCYGFDSGKNKALQTLVSNKACLRISDISSVTNCYGFDSGKTEAVSLLVQSMKEGINTHKPTGVCEREPKNKEVSISEEQMFDILNTLGHDSSRLEFLRDNHTNFVIFSSPEELVVKVADIFGSPDDFQEVCKFLRIPQELCENNMPSDECVVVIDGMEYRPGKGSKISQITRDGHEVTISRQKDGTVSILNEKRTAFGGYSSSSMTVGRCKRIVINGGTIRTCD